MNLWPLETLVHAEYKALTEYRDGAHPTEDMARDWWLRQMQTPPEVIDENVMRMRSLITHRESVSECRVQLALCFKLIQKARQLCPSLCPDDVDRLTEHILGGLHMFLRFAVENEWMDLASFFDRYGVVRRVLLRKSYFVDMSKGKENAMTIVYFYTNHSYSPFEECRYPGDIRLVERKMQWKSRYDPSSGRGVRILAPPMPIFHPARQAAVNRFAPPVPQRRPGLNSMIDFDLTKADSDEESGTAGGTMGAKMPIND